MLDTASSSMVTAGVWSHAKTPLGKKKRQRGKTDETELKGMLEEFSDTQKEETTWSPSAWTNRRQLHGLIKHTRGPLSKPVFFFLHVCSQI